MTGPGTTDYRSGAVRQTFVILIVLGLASASAPQALAQVDEELLEGGARGGGGGDYAWGDGARPAEPEDPLRIMAFLGAGVGFRLVRNIDSEFSQDFLAPAYMDLGAAVLFPGGDTRHGVGLGITTNLTADTPGASFSVGAGGQWLITPSYHFLLPLRRMVPDLQHDWLHIQGRIGIPLVISSGAGNGGSFVSVGGEVAGAVHFKFLAGLGLYAEVSVAVYGGSQGTFHPVIGVDGGFMFDYEVLP